MHGDTAHGEQPEKPLLNLKSVDNNMAGANAQDDANMKAPNAIHAGASPDAVDREKQLGERFKKLGGGLSHKMKKMYRKYDVTTESKYKEQTLNMI